MCIIIITLIILIDSSMESPVHVLMLSIQAVRGLPSLRAPGIVPCIISFSRQLPCYLHMPIGKLWTGYIVYCLLVCFCCNFVYLYGYGFLQRG